MIGYKHEREYSVNEPLYEATYNLITQILKRLKLVASELSNFKLLRVEKLHVVRLTFLIDGTVVSRILTLVLIKELDR